MLYVYGPVLYGEKLKFWNSLGRIRENIGPENYMLGYFNIVLKVVEKRGCMFDALFESGWKI